jgi:hypothetical protein
MRGVFARRPSPAQIRTTLSPILRRWIAAGDFFATQKLILPHQVSFLLRTNPQSTKLAKAGIYEHWMALIEFDSIGISTAQISRKYLGPDGKPTIMIDGGYQTNPIGHRAKEFFGQKMFFWKEKFYTREDVIKMHANRLGGVHLDFKRADDEAHINQIKNYFGFEIKPHTHQMLVGEEIEAARADVARRQNVYDATELVLLDSARIFSTSIELSQARFQALLVGGKPVA